MTTREPDNTKGVQKNKTLRMNAHMVLYNNQPYNIVGYL